MYSNVTQLRIEVTSKFIAFHPVNRYMEKEAQKKDEKVYPRWQVISIKEAEFALQCLNGKAPFYPFFDDLNHHIKFTPDGIQESSKDGSKWKDYYFTLPGKELVKWIEFALTMAPYFDGLNDKLKFTVNSEKLYQLKCQYAPRVKWDFRENVKDKLCKDLSDSNQSRLDNCLKGLTRIAKNYSNGKASKIFLSFDGWQPEDNPSSYYFVIYTSDDKVVMNGGIIAHKRDNNQVEYSTHT